MDPTGRGLHHGGAESRWLDAAASPAGGSALVQRPLFWSGALETDLPTTSTPSLSSPLAQGISGSSPPHPDCHSRGSTTLDHSRERPLGSCSRPPKLTRTVEPAAAADWACSACTLLNEASANRCVVCDALRGSSLAAAATLAEQEQHRPAHRASAVGAAGGGVRGSRAGGTGGRGARGGMAGGRGTRGPAARGDRSSSQPRGGADIVSFFKRAPPAG